MEIQQFSWKVEAFNQESQTKQVSEAYIPQEKPKE